ncbi:MAG: hypothetical protein P4M09_16555 [Devosia sp.]|nr:hypothetical protein [Devosia sp.]
MTQPPRQKRPRSVADDIWEAAAPFRKPNLTIEFRRPPAPSGAADPSPEEIRASWDPVLDHHRRHIDSTVNALRRRLAGLPCLPVLATLAVTTMMRTPETYRESESRYSDLYAEYATWLYLTSDEKPELLAPVLDGKDFQEVLDLLSDVIEVTRSYYLLEAQLARLSPETAAQEVGLRARL